MTDDTSPTAAHALIDVLASWGIHQVFTCPGSTEAPFLDASIDRPELDVWLTTHELTAVAMADGYARFSNGTPGVAYLHTNVGLVNGLGAVYAAQLARSPVVVLNGLKANVVQSRRGFTAVPDVGTLAATHVRWRWQSLRTDELATDLTRGLQIATTDPCGPVWLGLAEDLLAAPAEAVTMPPVRSRKVAPGRPDHQAVASAAAMLCEARRPLLVAGADVARQNACDAMITLAEHLGAAVVHEDRRSFERSAFPTDHPAYAGYYSHRHPLVERADVVAFLGGRCFHEFEAGSIEPPPEHVRVIHSNADATEVGKTYGADIGLVGDHRAVLADLLTAVKKRRRSSDRPRTALVRPAPRTFDSELVTVDRVIDVLATFVDGRTRIVADATTSNAALFERIPQTTPSQVITTSCGALGWGMGAALGVQIACPSDRVIAVVGDGSFQFGMQALWVAARRNLPVTFLVLNNESYAAVAAALQRYGRRATRLGRYPGKDIAGPDLTAIAEGFGVRARRVRAGADISEALGDALSAHAPRLVEVMTEPDDLGP